MLLAFKMRVTKRVLTPCLRSWGKPCLPRYAVAIKTMVTHGHIVVFLSWWDSYKTLSKVQNNYVELPHVIGPWGIPCLPE